MIQKLLVVMAVAALVSFVCFFVLGMIGGFPPRGFAGDGWTRHWRSGAGDFGGPQTTRNLAYSGGYKLVIGYPADVTVTQGSQPRFTVTGPQGLIDQMTLENGELSGPNGSHWNWGGWNSDDGRLHIDIVTPDTHEFHLSGPDNLSLRGYDQDTIELYISGSGDIDAQGKARRLEAHISGSGDLKLGELTVDDAAVSISGSGDARVDARKSSDVWLTGSGDVQLKCRPASTSERKTGSGDISYGPSCSELAPPASSAPPAAAAPPASPAPKSKV